MTISAAEGANDSLVINALGGQRHDQRVDHLDAGTVKLTLDGGAGDESSLGGRGADVLLGGDGDDFIDGDKATTWP